MPANLTPQYLEAELKFKQAKTIEAKIKALEAMMALTIHKDFVANLKYARIWGSEKFNGQRVKREFRAREGDGIEFHL